MTRLTVNEAGEKDTLVRIADALERLVLLMESRAVADEPRRVEPPGQFLPKRGAKRAA